MATTSPVGPGNGGDGLEQGLILVSPRRADEAADVALAQQQIIVIDEPRARARHEFGIVERRGGFAPEIGDEAAFGMLARLRPAEREQSSRLMVEQRASPPVERPDRGNPRRRASELAAEMLQHPGREISTELSVPPVILRKPI